MLKDGFISFEEFVDFVFSTGDKDFLSDADLEKVRQLSTRGFKEEKREKEGQSRENSPQPLWSIWKQPGFYRFLTRRCAPRRPHQPPFSYSILVCRATKIASTATMQWGCHRPLLIRRARRAFSFRVAGSNCHGQHVQPVCSRKVRMMLANIALATPKQILKSQPVQIWWRSTFHYFCSIFFLGGYMCIYVLYSFGTHFQLLLLRHQELEMLTNRVEELQLQLQRRDEVCWGTNGSGLGDGGWGLLGISRNRWLKGENIWTYDTLW